MKIEFNSVGVPYPRFETESYNELWEIFPNDIAQTEINLMAIRKVVIQELQEYKLEGKEMTIGIVKPDTTHIFLEYGVKELNIPTPELLHMIEEWYEFLIEFQQKEIKT